MKTKVCTKCGECRAVDEFSSGAYQCKHCFHQYYLKNRATLLEKKRLYRERNKEAIRARWCEWAKTEQGKAHADRHGKNRQSKLTDGYVWARVNRGGALTGAPNKAELIQLKRESILLKRLGKQIKEAINPTKEEP